MLSALSIFGLREWLFPNSDLLACLKIQIIYFYKIKMEILNGGHASNVRYQLAKNQIENLFLKWISGPQTQKLIN